MANDESSVDVKTPWFGVGMKGTDATSFFIILLLIVLSGLTVWQHTLRSREHEQIMCSTKLAIFIFTSPRSEKGTLEVNWERLPVDLYGCLPQFLYKTTR